MINFWVLLAIGFAIVGLVTFLGVWLCRKYVEDHAVTYSVPEPDKRYVTPMEEMMKCFTRAEGDDTLVMHQLRSMGYFGGWSTREAYLKGKKHGAGGLKCRNCGCNEMEEKV